MKPLRLFIGRRQRDREQALLRWLEPYADPVSRRIDALILVPGRRRADALKKAAARHFNGKIWAPQVHTFETLLREQAYALTPPGLWLQENARAGLAQRLMQREQLFETEPSTRSFAKQALDKLYDMSAEEMDEAPPVWRRFAALYDAELKRLNMWDARRAAAQYGAGWSVSGGAVALDEFARLRKMELQLFETMRPAFGASAASIAECEETEPLRKRLQESGAETQTAEPENMTFTQRVGDSLFQLGERLEEPEESGFRVLSCASRRDEARAAARLIRLELGGADPKEADFRRFTVAAPSLRAYQDLIASEFASYGLPTRFGRGAPLLQFAALRFAHTLLERIALKRSGDGVPEPWDLEDLSETLTRAEVSHSDDLSGRASELLERPVSPEDRRTGFSMRRLERQARAAGLFIAPFNAETWMRSIAGSFSEAPSDESDFFNEQPDEPDRKAVLAAFDLSEAERFVRKAGDFSSAESAREAGAALESLFSDYGLNLINPRERKAWSMFQRLLREAERAFHGARGERFDPGAYADFLTQSLADPGRTMESTPVENAVSVVAFQEAAGLSFQKVFALGLVEGEAPAPASRSAAADGPGQIPGRFFFQQILLNADSAVLTHPRRERGRRMERSPFIDDVTALLGDTGMDDLNPLEGGEQDPLGNDESAALLCSRDALIAMGQRCNGEAHEQLFLPETNVPRLLEQERARQSREAWSEHDGHIGDDPRAKTILRELVTLPDNEEEEEPPQPYSANRLETYAHCPMRYFFSSALQLREQETDDSDVAPNAYGELVHEILERFFRGWPGRANEVDDAGAERLRGNMLQIAVECARPYDARYRNLYWQERKRELISGLVSGGEPKGILRRFLDAELDGSYFAFGADFQRGHTLEAVFGKIPRRDSHLNLPPVQIPRPKLEESEDGGVDAIDEPIQVRGIIDRIDIDPSTGQFAVYDYKTGQLPPARKTLDGLRFQLPLYMIAAAGQKECREPIGGAFYSAGDPRHVGSQAPIGAFAEGGRRRAGKMEDGAEVGSLLEYTRERIVEVDKHIREGRFHTTLLQPSEAGCNYCEFKDACRLDTTRQRAMPKNMEAYRPLPFGAEAEEEDETKEDAGGANKANGAETNHA